MTLFRMLVAASAAVALSAGVAAAQTSANCADPAGSCAATLPTECVSTLGAGSTPSDTAAAPTCAAPLAAYRACLSDAAERCVTVQADTGAEPPNAVRGFFVALKAELETNIARLKDLRANMSLDGQWNIYEDGWPTLARDVVGATANPVYFSAPPGWTVRTSDTYDAAATLIADGDVRHAYRHGTQSTIADRRDAAEQLDAIIARLETELLPEIAAALDQ